MWDVAHALWQSMRLNQRLPFRVLPLHCLPALSLLAGQIPTHEARCWAVENSFMFAPISGTVLLALWSDPLRGCVQQLNLILILKRLIAFLNFQCELRNRCVQKLQLDPFAIDRFVSALELAVGLYRQLHSAS